MGLWAESRGAFILGKPAHGLLYLDSSLSWAYSQGAFLALVLGHWPVFLIGGPLLRLLARERRLRAAGRAECSEFAALLCLARGPGDEAAVRFLRIKFARPTA